MTNEVTDNSQQVSQVEKKPKRFIWITGGKGGVGKSTLARGLRDILHTAGVKVVAVDGDLDNAQLYRYYKDVDDGVIRTELKGTGVAPLLNAMEARVADVILVDVAAGGSRTLAELDKSVRLFFNAADMGYQTTVVSVLSRIKDSVNLLKATMEMTEGKEIDLVAVKNLYFGTPERFRLFDDSKTKQRLIEQGGLVLEMPEMADDVYEILDQKNMPFYLAQAEAGGLPLMERSMVFRWLEDFEQEVRRARGMLWL